MIRLEGIARTFQVGDQPVHALHDIDLTLADGEYAALMGPSGSGKSTLLNILGLLDRPDSGRYRLDRVETTTLGEEQRARVRRDRIGFVFQSFHLIPRLSAAENVELPLVLAGLAPRERRQRVAHILEALGLTERAQHRPDQLSGGQRQRVAIARATIMAPKLLLADEPTAAVDGTRARAIVGDFRSLARAEGCAILMVSHDLRLVEAFADRTYGYRLEAVSATLTRSTCVPQAGVST